jgi:lipoprotein-releasing system permease protein
VFFAYFKYFFKFIVFSKNRQRLLILAIAGLFLSSMALIILQSTMGGLQNKLMERSKNVMGDAYLKINDYDSSQLQSIINKLDSQKISYIKEYEIELMVKYRSFITPVIAHGIDTNGYLPNFLKKENFVNAIMPLEIAYKMEFSAPDEAKLISPSHVDSLFIDVPRSQSIKIEKVFSTDVPEVDSYHLWVRLPLIQNLIQSKTINRIRIFSKSDLNFLKQNLPPGIKFRSWEEENGPLVWALNLESTVMVFLFAAMSLLVSLCITSGLLIFFNKIKNDLSSFWILGASLKKINFSTRLFLHLMTLTSILAGLMIGVLFLYIFDKVGADIMPDVFVDRKIPVLVSLKGISISVLVPYLISFIFIELSISQFKKDYNLLDHVRSVS